MCIKNSYTSFCHANKVLRNMRDPMVFPYVCPECGLVHIGHKPGTSRALRYKKRREELKELSLLQEAA